MLNCSYLETFTRDGLTNTPIVASRKDPPKKNCPKRPKKKHNYIWIDGSESAFQKKVFYDLA